MDGKKTRKKMKKGITNIPITETYYVHTTKYNYVVFAKPSLQEAELRVLRMRNVCYSFYNITAAIAKLFWLF